MFTQNNIPKNRAEYCEVGGILGSIPAPEPIKLRSQIRSNFPRFDLPFLRPRSLSSNAYTLRRTGPPPGRGGRVARPLGGPPDSGVCDQAMRGSRADRSRSIRAPCNSMKNTKVLHFGSCRKPAARGRAARVETLRRRHADGRPAAYRLDLSLPGLGAHFVLSSNSVLHCLAGSEATIYLDFDGHFEAGWGFPSNIDSPAYDIDGDPSTFSAREIASILRIREHQPRQSSYHFKCYDAVLRDVSPAGVSRPSWRS